MSLIVYLLNFSINPRRLTMLLRSGTPIYLATILPSWDSIKVLMSISLRLMSPLFFASSIMLNPRFVYAMTVDVPTSSSSVTLGMGRRSEPIAMSEWMFMWLSQKRQPIGDDKLSSGTDPQKSGCGIVMVPQVVSRLIDPGHAPCRDETASGLHLTPL